jgi:DNA-binding transcriptional MerR regulator
MAAVDTRKIPNKLFFKIGEVCELTDTQPYVLRYWESEFPSLAPAKNSSGQRIYRRRDIETVLHIKQLLYEEGFTIAGAKKKIEADAGKPDAAADKEPKQDSFLDDADVDADADTDGDADRDRGARQGSKAPVTTVKVNRNNERVLREVRAQLAEILTLLNSGDKIS